jgi:thymidylate kinase
VNIYIIEGIDGAGKSTAILAIREMFPGKKILQFKEPDGFFHQILAKAAATDNISKMDEYMTFWMCRFDLWMNKILPEVDNLDVVVIIDRSFASTFAYQIEGRGLLEYEKSFFFWKRNLLSIFDGKMVEIHHLYLRVSVEIGLSRIGIRGPGQNDLTQFERRDNLQRVKAGFDFFYGPGNKCNFSPIEYIHIIDAGQSVDDVIAQIKSEIAP